MTSAASHTQWEKRYIKMLISVRKEIARRNDPSDTEVLIAALIEAYQHCSNRKGSELERLYFAYVVPHANGDYIQSQGPIETLIYAFSNLRIHIRDKIITTICNDRHNAASETYFCRLLNKSVFYLPDPPLNGVDLNFSNYAMKEKEQLIIKSFKKCYESPNTIYTAFNDMLYPKPGAKHPYPPSEFTKWLESKGRMNESAFEDLDTGKIKPQLAIDYLEELGFYEKIN
jgi:hypothetical protein